MGLIYVKLIYVELIHQVEVERNDLEQERQRLVIQNAESSIVYEAHMYETNMAQYTRLWGNIRSNIRTCKLMYV